MDKVLHMVLYLRCTIMDLKKKKKKSLSLISLTKFFLDFADVIHGH